MWTTHSAGSAVHPKKRNGSAHIPAETSQRAQRLNAILNKLSRGSDAPVEEGAGLEHRMHDNGEFPRDRNGSARPCCTDRIVHALMAPGPAFRRYERTSDVQAQAYGSAHELR
jgi:hypothetical protein